MKDWNRKSVYVLSVIGLVVCGFLLLLGTIGNLPEMAIIVALAIFTFLGVRALFGLLRSQRRGDV